MVGQTQFEGESYIAVIVVDFEEIAEKDLWKKPSLRLNPLLLLLWYNLRR